MIPISVIVPTRNAEGMLEECLASIARNQPAEIIVVDGLSNDRTVEIARSYGARVLSDEGQGLPAARAIGATAATTATVALIDADVVLPDGALAALDQERRERGLVALQAGLTSEGGPDYWSKALAAHHRMGRSRHWFGVAATVADRSVILEQGFDARFPSGEDIDLRWRMLRRGLPVGVSSGCMVRHRFGEGFGFAHDQWTDDGRGLARMVLAHGVPALRLLGLPIAGAMRGVLLSLIRLQPQWILYFIAYMVFNYAAMVRCLIVEGGRLLREPGEERLGKLSLLGNSLALSSARVGTMTVGFATWFIAARLYDRASVGLAAGVVAATMLCVQLAQLGVGTALLLDLPPDARRRRHHVEVAAGIIVVAGLLVPLIMLALAAAGLKELVVVVHDPWFALAFVGVCLFSTWAFFLDHVAVAFRSAHHALVRNMLTAILTFLLVAIPGALIGGGARMIVAAWLIGATAGAVVGVYHLVGSLGNGIIRPRLERATGRRLLRIGIPNHVLALVERAPGLVLPIVVIETLSPAINAVWYATWMMAWAAYFVPQSTGIAMLAETAHGPGAMSATVARARRSSLAIGSGVAIVAAIVGPMLLRVLGPSYADGTVPLLILLIAVVPAVYIQMYFAVCRNTNRVGEAIAAGAVSGLAAIAGAIVTSRPYGLIGPAAAWTITQIVTGLWAVSRLRALQGTVAPPPSETAHALKPVHTASTVWTRSRRRR